MKRNLLYLLTFIVLGMIVLRFFTYHYLIWDEAVYLAIGKWLFSGGELGIWENFRPIGLSMILGALWKTGLDYLFLADVLMLGFLVGSAILMYYLTEEDKTLAVLMLVLTPVFFIQSIRVMTDIPAMFLILLSLYLFRKKNLEAAGLVVGIAFTFRFPVGLMILALNMIMILRKSRWTYFLRMNLPFAGIILTYAIYLIAAYGSLDPLIAAGQHQSSAVRSVSGILQNILYYPYTLIVTNLLLVFAFFNRKLKKDILVPLIIFLGYFTIIGHKTPRFALMFLPFAVMLAVSGMQMIRNKEFRFAVFILLLIPTIHINMQMIGNLPREEPSQVQFLSSFKGEILTSNPLPAFYSDARFYHYYNNLEDAHIILDKGLEVDTIIYTPASFPCTDCTLKDELEEKLSGNLVYNATFYDSQWLVFKQN